VVRLNKASPWTDCAFENETHSRKEIDKGNNVI
jgi:hypothetical protein